MTTTTTYTTTATIKFEVRCGTCKRSSLFIISIPSIYNTYMCITQTNRKKYTQAIGFFQFQNIRVHWAAPRIYIMMTNIIYNTHTHTNGIHHKYTIRAAYISILCSLCAYTCCMLVYKHIQIGKVSSRRSSSSRSNNKWRRRQRQRRRPAFRHVFFLFLVVLFHFFLFLFSTFVPCVCLSVCVCVSVSMSVRPYACVCVNVTDGVTFAVCPCVCGPVCMCMVDNIRACTKTKPIWLIYDSCHSKVYILYDTLCAVVHGHERQRKIYYTCIYTPRNCVYIALWLG